LDEAWKRQDPLLDVGEILDKMTLKSKTDNRNYFDFVEDYNKKPQRAGREYKSTDFQF
jgi:hypothetical protein